MKIFILFFIFDEVKPLFPWAALLILTISPSEGQGRAEQTAPWQTSKVLTDLTSQDIITTAKTSMHMKAHSKPVIAGSCGAT